MDLAKDLDELRAFRKAILAIPGEFRVNGADIKAREVTALSQEISDLEKLISKAAD